MPSLSDFVIGSVALFIGCTVSSAGGVGGGGINVPIFLLIFGYSFKRSAINSYYVVLGNAFAQSLLNIGRNHPKFHAYPMIFWEFVCMLLPAQIGGSSIGAFMVPLVPDFALYLLALVVLLFASVFSFHKGLGKWRIENDKLAAKTIIQNPGLQSKTAVESKIDGRGVSAVQNPIRRSEVFSIESAPAPNEEVIDDDEARVSIIDQLHATTVALRSLSRDHRASVVHEAEAITLPANVLRVIFLMWLSFTALVVGLQFIAKCSVPFGIVFALLYVPLSFCTVWTINFLKAQRGANSNSLHQAFGNGQSIISHGDATNGFKVSDVYEVDLVKESWRLAAGEFCIGIICSLLGIGGGELNSPLMLSLHIRPEVTSATSAMMSFLNTAVLVVISLTENPVDHGTKTIFLAAGFFGGLVRYLKVWESQLHNLCSRRRIGAHLCLLYL